MTQTLKKFVVVCAWVLFAFASPGVELLWDRNLEPNVAGYRVYLGTAPRVYSIVADANNRTQHYFPDPPPGITEFYAATAYDFNGNESDFSDEVSFTGPPGPTLPDDPLFEWHAGNRLYYDKGGQIFRNDFQWALFNPGCQGSQVYLTSTGELMGDGFAEPPGCYSANVLPAWNTVSAAPDVLIALIDNGFLTTHEDLHGRFVPGAILIDGTLFENVPEMTVTTGRSHGTMTAGVIGAIGNNGIGISGVLRDGAKLLPLWVESDEDIAAALVYAVDHGARIVNFPWGIADPRPSWRAAFQHAFDHGVLVVCAGLEGLSIPATDYPAMWKPEFDNIVLVGGHDRDGSLWPSSGWQHAGYIDLLAPGRVIAATFPDDETWPGTKYRYTSGTSFACAFATGAAALVWQHHPEFAARDVRRALMETVTHDELFVGLSISGGILNVAGAVNWERPMELLWQIPAGPHLIESTDGFGETVTEWTVVQTVEGPLVYHIPVNPGVPHRFYRYSAQ